MLWIMPDDVFQAEIDQGRHYLLAFRPNVFPWLFDEDSLINPTGVDMREIAHLSNVPPEKVNLKVFWDAIIVEAQKIERRNKLCK